MQQSTADKLLLLPIFQGFSRLDFLDVVEKTPLEFLNFKSGQTVVKRNDECSHLYLITEGRVVARLCEPEEGYDYFETLSVPLVVQPECLFGLHNRFTRTFTAQTEVAVVRIEKLWVHNLFRTHVAFQLNFLNLVCTESQRLGSVLTARQPATLEQRFGAFLRSRSIRPSGPKQLKMRMADLAKILGTSRLEVSRMLRALQGRHLLTSSRLRIVVPFLEMLPV